MIFEVALYYYLYVSVVCCRLDAVVHCRQPEAHVINIKIPEAGIFAFDDLDS